MLDPYIQQIYTDGTDQQLQPRWSPAGIIIINECDAVVRVTDGRQVWRVSPGRTVARPIVAPVPGGYTARSEIAATQGSAIIIFTQEPITAIVGEDASLANLFRRTVIDAQNTTTANNVVVVDTTIQLGAARLVQLLIVASVQSTDGTVSVLITDGRATGTPQTLERFTIPYTAGDSSAYNFRFGDGQRVLPRALRVRVTSSAGFASPLNDVSVYGDVWEGN